MASVSVLRLPGADRETSASSCWMSHVVAGQDCPAILALLKALQQKISAGLYFISHDLRVVRTLCHQVMVLRQGEVVEQGECERVLPLHSRNIPASFWRWADGQNGLWPENGSAIATPKFFSRQVAANSSCKFTNRHGSPSHSTMEHRLRCR